MSDFLLIVPIDWYEVINLEGVLSYGDVPSVQSNIAANSFGELEQALEGVGEMDANISSIWGAKLFDDGGGYHLWVKIGVLR